MNLVKQHKLVQIDVSVEGLLKSFLSGRKRTTILAYRHDLKEFAKFLQNESIEESVKTLLSLELGQANATVLSYKNYLIDNLKLQSATVNRRLASIRAVTKLARILGVIFWEVEIENQKHQAYRDVRGIGLESLKKIFKLLEGKEDYKSIRDLAILRLLFDLGLRREEVCNLELSDIDFSQKTVAVLSKGKSSKEFMSLPDATLEVVQNWIVVRGSDNGPLFFRLDRAKGAIKIRLTGTGLYKIVKDLGLKIGITNFTVHKFRHEAITSVAKVIAENNMGIETILKFSRHKSLNTALIYFDHLEDKQGLLSELVSKKI